MGRVIVLGVVPTAGRRNGGSVGCKGRRPALAYTSCLYVLSMRALLVLLIYPMLLHGSATCCCGNELGGLKDLRPARHTKCMRPVFGANCALCYSSYNQDQI